MKNCKIGGCEYASLQTCPSCIQWIPSTGSKYYRCARFLSKKLLCDLPASDCAGCSYYLTPGVGAPGRENKTGFDWSDPRSHTEYKKRKRLAILPSGGLVKCDLCAEPANFRHLGGHQLKFPM